MRRREKVAPLKLFETMTSPCLFFKHMSEVWLLMREAYISRYGFTGSVLSPMKTNLSCCSVTWLRLDRAERTSCAMGATMSWQTFAATAGTRFSHGWSNCLHAVSLWQYNQAIQEPGLPVASQSPQ